MNTRTNESTSSLEHFVQKNEQQPTIEKEHINSDTGERLATQKDIQEILQKIEKLQVSFDTMMDIR